MFPTTAESRSIQSRRFADKQAALEWCFCGAYNVPNLDRFEGMCGSNGAAGGNTASDEGSVRNKHNLVSRSPVWSPKDCFPILRCPPTKQACAKCCLPSCGRHCRLAQSTGGSGNALDGNVVTQCLSVCFQQQNTKPKIHVVKHTQRPASGLGLDFLPRRWQ